MVRESLNQIYAEGACGPLVDLTPKRLLVGSGPSDTNRTVEIFTPSQGQCHVAKQNARLGTVQVENSH